MEQLVLGRQFVVRWHVSISASCRSRSESVEHRHPMSRARTTLRSACYVQCNTGRCVHSQLRTDFVDVYAMEESGRHQPRVDVGAVQQLSERHCQNTMLTWRIRLMVNPHTKPKLQAYNGIISMATRMAEVSTQPYRQHRSACRRGWVDKAEHQLMPIHVTYAVSSRIVLAIHLIAMLVVCGIFTIRIVRNEVWQLTSQCRVDRASQCRCRRQSRVFARYTVGDKHIGQPRHIEIAALNINCCFSFFLLPVRTSAQHSIRSSLPAIVYMAFARPAITAFDMALC